MPGETSQDFDSPWKDALARFFEEFLRLVAPEIHRAIDWSRGFELLDRELRKITRDAALGRGEADMLARVHLLGGGDAWILTHVEAQGNREAEFDRRMFLYYVRIVARYRRPVLSIAVLTDRDPSWRPDHYDATVLGSGAQFGFHVVKLLDFRDCTDELIHDGNPFGLVLLAHLRALETGADRERLAFKVGLIRDLLRQRFPADTVYHLFRLLDWLLTLPESLQGEFDQEAERIEEENAVTFITSIERKAMARGHRESIREVLDGRFGSVPDPIAEALERTTDSDVLRALVRAAAVTPSLDEFAEELPPNEA